MDLSSHSGVHRIFTELSSVQGAWGGSGEAESAVRKRFSVRPQFLFDFDQAGAAAGFEMSPCTAV